MKDYVIIAVLVLGASCVALRNQPEAEPEASGTPAAAPAALGPIDPLANPLSKTVAALAGGGGTEAALSLDLLAPSLDYLERDGIAWMHGESELNLQNGCISCHVVSFALWSHRAIEAAGGVTRAPIDDLMAEAMEFISQPGIGRAPTWSQMLFARSPADIDTFDWREVTDGLVGIQESDGRWRARGQFPEQRRGEREGDAVATMWALLALDRVPERESYVEEAMVDGLEWLRSQPAGASSEWHAMRLLVERRFGDEGTLATQLDRFLAAQRSDGGWSWLIDEAADPSDAYSAGVGLYALRRAGLETTHPAVRRAVGYLLENRTDEGIWQVSSALTSAEASAEKDYIYEYWGTAWAVIGLAEVLPAVAAEPVEIAAAN